MTETASAHAGGGARRLLTAAISSALLGWMALLAVAQLAGGAGYATFAVLWAVYYAVAGTLAGLQHEVTRSAVEPQEPAATGRLATAAYMVGAGTGLLGVASFPLWNGSISAKAPVALTLAAGLLGLAGLVIVLGLLAAERQWASVACLLIIDAVVRLALVVTAAAVGASTAWVMAAIGCASWVWVPGVFVLRGRAALQNGSSSVVRRTFVRRAGAAMTATGFGALLIAGLPWMVAATASEPLAESDAGILAALVLFRSPVLVLVYGLRPLILRDMLTHPERAVCAVSRAWAVYGAGGVIGCGVGFATGPDLLSATFGSEFDVTRVQAGVLVLSASLLAMTTHGSLAFVAADAHLRATQSWGLAVVATVGALYLPIAVDARVLVAALAGPMVALVWQVLQLGELRVWGQSSPSENADSRSWRE
jgi:hypothetical protein